MFIPEARISVSGSSASETESNHSSMLSRYIAVDALRYGSTTLSYNTYEILNYSWSGSSLNFRSIFYNMEYVNLRYDSSYGRIEAYIDHRCINYINMERLEPSEASNMRWYGYGFRLESPGMMIGYKDNRYGYSLFSENDFLNLSFSARKPLVTRNYPYDYIADLTFRYDIYLYSRIIPFISGSAELLYSEKNKWNYNAGTGIRFDAAGVDIIPYVDLTAFHSIDSAYGPVSRYWQAGLTFESKLTENATTPDGNMLPGIIPALHPELHARGSYSKFIGDENRNFRSDILLSFNILTSGNSGIYAATSLIHASPKLQNETGLYPRYIDYYYETGLSFNSHCGIFVEPLYRFTGFGEGNTVEAGGYTYHLTGLRLCTAGMKPGYINSRISNRFIGSFALLLNTEAEITAGWIPSGGIDNKYFLAGVSVREDIFSYKSAVPYISLNAEIEKGIIPGEEKIIRTVTPEFGIRFNRKILFTIYYQYKQRNSSNDEYDVNNVYHFGGVRLEL